MMLKFMLTVILVAAAVVNAKDSAAKPNIIFLLSDDPGNGGHEQISFINTWGPIAVKSLTAITEKYKYTYWWYGDDTMEPTEDLFDLSRDSLEMTNLNNDIEYEWLLKDMRAKYDQKLELWKNANQDENHYALYNTLFDRNIPLDAKQAVMKEMLDGMQKRYGGKGNKAKERSEKTTKQ